VSSVRTSVPSVSKKRLMKSLLSFRPTSPVSKNHRSTLLALHRSGMMQVFRRHSFFRIWVPLREAFTGSDRFSN